MIKVLTPTENSKKQSDNTKNATKTSITQRLQTDLSPIYTICFDRHVSKQTKRHIAHTRVYTVCLTELSLNFSLQNNFLCLHNLNMEEDNFVIPACILVIAAFCLMSMNLSVSDGVKLNSSFLFLCRILNQVAKFFIETETHQLHVIFFICIIYV